MSRNVQESSFFLSKKKGEDAGYGNVRDSPNWVKCRSFVEELWRKYEPYADKHCRTDAQSHFLQRFWEMYVCMTFIHRGFSPKRHSSTGPEFYISMAGRRVWIECIAPNQGEGQNQVPEPPYGEVSEVPAEKIILRYTSALKEKLRTYRVNCDKNIIQNTDCYVVAINSRGIPHAPYGSHLPYHVQAFLPFGNRMVMIDTKTNKITDSFLQHRDSVTNSNNKAISTKPFLENTYKGISAVIHSGADCANGPLELGADFDVLHNPLAMNPMSIDNLSWCRNRIYCDGELKTIESKQESID